MALAAPKVLPERNAKIFYAILVWNLWLFRGSLIFTVRVSNLHLQFSVDKINNQHEMITRATATFPHIYLSMKKTLEKKLWFLSGMCYNIEILVKTNIVNMYWTGPTFSLNTERWIPAVYSEQDRSTARWADVLLQLLLLVTLFFRS